MNRYALYHCGMDNSGRRHWQLRPVAAARRSQQQMALFPRVVCMARCGPGKEVWRNGFHQRRWYLVAAQVRSDRRCFLTTLPQPALVSPILPAFASDSATMGRF